MTEQVQSCPPHSPLLVQTPRGGGSFEVRLGCPGRTALPGHDLQRPAGPVAARGRSGAQGAARQVPAGHNKVTVPKAHLSIVRLLGPGTVLGAVGAKWSRTKSLVSHLIGGERQETHRNRVFLNCFCPISLILTLVFIIFFLLLPLPLI